jgi:Fur family ferric uptake transcriptional regulator
MSDQINVITETLAEKGYRLTAARRAIVRALVESGGHVSADDLADRVRAESPSVGRMTVYRTLDLLCSLALIRPIYQGSGAAHYVLMDEGSHHHLVCIRCERVIEFDHCGSDALGEALSQRYDFQIHSHLLEFHGVCRACRERTSRASS